jgi:hypothetical protein
MKILASRIAKEFKEARHCGIYEPELSRVWPRNGTSREAEIAYFATKFGWRLRYYKEGFCAIFDKEPVAD